MNKTVKIICGYCQKTEMGFREVPDTYQPDFTYAVEYDKTHQISACCEKCQVLLDKYGHYEAITRARRGESV